MAALAIRLGIRYSEKRDEMQARKNQLLGAVGLREVLMIMARIPGCRKSLFDFSALVNQQISFRSSGEKKKMRRRIWSIQPMLVLKWSLLWLDQ